MPYEEEKRNETCTTSLRVYYVEVCVAEFISGTKRLWTPVRWRESPLTPKAVTYPMICHNDSPRGWGSGKEVIGFITIS